MTTTTIGTMAALAILSLSLRTAPARSGGRPASPAQLQPTLSARMNAFPRGFIPNVGQLREDAMKFTLRDNGVTAHFTDRGFVLWTGQSAAVAQDGLGLKFPVAPRWTVVGARQVEPVGGAAFAHTVSFFLGSDPANWRPSVPAYRESTRFPSPARSMRVWKVGQSITQARSSSPQGAVRAVTCLSTIRKQPFRKLSLRPRSSET